MQNFILLLGRILLSALFILGGWEKIPAFVQTAAGMAAKGLPAAKALLVVAIIIELGGGFMLLLGWWTRLTALIFFLYLIPVTLVYHRFWGLADPAAAHANLIHFMKNLAIMGGMLYVYAAGAGAASVDHRLAARRPKLAHLRF